MSAIVAWEHNPKMNCVRLDLNKVKANPKPGIRLHSDMITVCIQYIIGDWIYFMKRNCKGQRQVGRCTRDYFRRQFDGCEHNDFPKG